MPDDELELEPEILTATPGGQLLRSGVPQTAAGPADLGIVPLDVEIPEIPISRPSADQPTDAAFSDATLANADDEALATELETLSTEPPIQSTLPPEIESSIREDEKNLEAQITSEQFAAEKQFDKEIQGIKDVFSELTTEQQEAQAQEFGALVQGLARAGGFLGFTASQQGVLQNLSLLHKREIAALETRKVAALREANDAFEDRNNELAREKLQIVRDTKKEIADRTNEFVNQQITIAREQRAVIEEQRVKRIFERSRAVEELDLLIEGGITPSDEQFEDLAKRVGGGLTIDQVKALFNDRRAELIEERRVEKAKADAKLIEDGITLFGLGETATEIESGLTDAVSRINLLDSDDTEGKDEILANISGDVRAFIKVSVDPILGKFRASFSRPTSAQFEEIIGNRQAVRLAGVGKIEEQEVRKTLGLDTDTMLDLVSFGINAGDTNDTIISDIQAISPNTSRNTILKFISAAREREQQPEAGTIAASIGRAIRGGTVGLTGELFK